MEEYIYRQITENKKFVLANSFANCHIKGVHSIALSRDEEGRMMRMFVTDENHELKKHSLAIHPHRQNITLHCVKGMFYNFCYREDKVLADDHSLYNKFIYESPIINQKGSFIKEKDKVELFNYKACYYRPGESVFMRATELHSVVCPQQFNCWIVQEGQVDFNYKNIAYSKKTAIKIEEDMYQPIKEEKLMEIVYKIIKK